MKKWLLSITAIMAVVVCIKAASQTDHAIIGSGAEFESESEACSRAKQRARNRCAVAGVQSISSCVCEDHTAGYSSGGTHPTVWTCEVSVQCNPMFPNN